MAGKKVTKIEYQRLFSDCKKIYLRVYKAYILGQDMVQYAFLMEKEEKNNKPASKLESSLNK